MSYFAPGEEGKDTLFCEPHDEVKSNCAACLRSALARQASELEAAKKETADYDALLDFDGKRWLGDSWDRIYGGNSYARAGVAFVRLKDANAENAALKAQLASQTEAARGLWKQVQIVLEDDISLVNGSLHQAWLVLDKVLGEPNLDGHLPPAPSEAKEAKPFASKCRCCGEMSPWAVDDAGGFCSSCTDRDCSCASTPVPTADKTDESKER